MKVRNVRVATALTAFGLMIALAGLIAPSAFGATVELRFVDPDGPATGQPQDAKVNETIRTADLNVGSGFVQVEVVDAVTKARITNFSKPIGFVLSKIPELQANAAAMTSGDMTAAAAGRSQLSLIRLLGWVAPVIVLVFGVMKSSPGVNRYGEARQTA